tara:strand:+ start:423 stop:2411 length:1989 start_codon:yes stop_codon:yes gene_type:complete
MASKKNVNININTKGGKKAQGIFNKVEGSIGKMGKAAIIAGASFFGARAILGGMQTAIRLSSEMEGVRRGFDNLAKSSGFSAQAFDKFNTATDGTMDSMELMQQANNAMLLGITDNEEQMAKMFDQAQRLASALGKDTAFGIESMVTGLGRQSKLMLDNLGIMFDANKANEDYAKSLGKTADKLTDQERKQAFTNAALAAADKLVAGLGEEQLTTRDKILQMNSAFGDLGVTIGDKLAPTVRVVTNALTGFAKNVTESISSINFTQTFKNALKNTEAFSRALIKTIRAYFDYLPDYWINIFKGFTNSINKLPSTALVAFENLLKLVKEVAAIIWEPLSVSLSHIGQRIKNNFIVIINGLIEGVNFLIEKLNTVGTALGFDDIPTINLLDKVKVDPLLDKLKETKIGDFIIPAEDEITSFKEFAETSGGIWLEYLDEITALNKETKAEEIQTHIDGEKVKLEESKKTIRLLTDAEKKKIATMKQTFDAGVGFANSLDAHKKMLRDNEMNAQIKAILNSQMTEEQKEASIANIKETFRLKDIEAARKMKGIKKAEAVMNTAVAVTDALPNWVLAALIAAKGAVEVATIDAQQFAKGGIVKGYGDQDTVPAMLTPGELILNRAQQDNLAGGMGGVTINIGGNIIGEESFVRDTLIPEIERARTLA